MIDPQTLMADWPRLLWVVALPALSLLVAVFVWLVLVGAARLARRQ